MENKAIPNDKLLIGLYLLKNLGSVGRLKKENRNMNIIKKGCDVIHNTYKLLQQGTKVVTPIALCDRSPLRYRSSSINHHTGPCITASDSHLSFLLGMCLKPYTCFFNYPKIFVCKLKYQKLGSVRPDNQFGVA